MTTEQPLETTAPADSGATQTATPAPAPVNAGPSAADREKELKQARAEGYQKAQSEFAKQQAREEKARREAERARAQLKQAGAHDDTAIDEVLVWRQKAAKLEEREAEEAEAQSAWQELERVASIYQVDPHDTRLHNLSSWEAVHAQALALAQANAEARLTAAKKAEEAARQKAVDSQIESGALDTLGGSPAAAPGLSDQYKKEMQAARGKGTAAGAAIREKYREQGVDVNSIKVL